MKTIPLPVQEILAYLVVSFFLAANVTHAQPAPTTSNNQSSNKIEADAFHEQLYKSIDGTKVLTLISKDECEITYAGSGFGTLLCKYTKQNDKLRVVETALGTTLVLYYRITDQGLRDNEGNVLLSPAGYTDAIARLESQRKAKQIEDQRVARVAVESKIASQTNATFSVINRSILTLTDVSLKIDNDQNYISNRAEIYFSEIYEIPDGYKIPNTEGVFFSVNYVRDERSIWLSPECKSEDQAKFIRDAIVRAFNAWKVKFPEASHYKDQLGPSPSTPITAPEPANPAGEAGALASIKEGRSKLLQKDYT